MDEKKKVPKLRFPGFTDDWEQRKFGDVGSVAMCKRIFKGQTSDKGEVPFYKIGTFGGKPDAFISRELFNEYKTKYPYPNKGDILISASGSIGRTVEFTGKDEYFQDSNIVWLKHESEIDNNFLKVLYSVVEWSCEGSTIKRLYNDNFLKTEFMLPQIDEQIKLGTFFASLDNLITLHQRKLQHIKDFKKAMLQKMFPKKGEKYPEIRFPEFTDAWEQRKLDAAAKFSKGNGYSKRDLIESGTPIILYGRLYTKYETSISDVDTYVEAKEGSIYSKGGEVIVPASGETADDIARAATIDKSGILLGGDLNVVMPNEDINPAFLAISISNGNSQRELAKKAQGKSVVHIHNEDIGNLIVPFPTKAEQNKIVDYFSNIDNLITLHQRELENLKKLKKACLQKMFV